MEGQGPSTSAEEETKTVVNDLENNDEPSEEDATANDASEVQGTDNTKLTNVNAKTEQKDCKDRATDRLTARLREKFKSEKEDFTAKIESQKHLIDVYQKENERLKTFEDNWPQLVEEINRLKGFEAVYPAHEEHIRKLENQQKMANNARIKLENNLQQAENQISSLNGIILALRNDNRSLEEEKQHLLLRLSKLAGAKLTLDNPNIADLSDSKRPTKLAEEFAEIYDNEWTDAFEDVTIDNEQEKTTFMVKLLQRASEICCEVSNKHMDGIKKSMCTLAVCTNDQTKTRLERTTNATMDIREQTELTNSKRLRRDNKYKPIEPHGPSMVVDRSDLITSLSHIKLQEVTYDFNKLQHDQKKTIMELRKFIEVSLSGQLGAVICEIIGRENSIDQQNQEKVISYIKKCVDICWSMCQHEPPVFISFPTVQGDVRLDTNIYKPYTKTGKLIDFVVWPALYLHEGGPVLSKGVAQGRA